MLEIVRWTSAVSLHISFVFLITILVTAVKCNLKHRFIQKRFPRFQFQHLCCAARGQ